MQVGMRPLTEQILYQVEFLNDVRSGIAPENGMQERTPGSLRWVRESRHFKWVTGNLAKLKSDRIILARALKALQHTAWVTLRHQRAFRHRSASQ